MFELSYNKNIEPELRADIDRILARWSWIVPRWCRRIQVNLSSNAEDNETVAVTINYEYRAACLDFVCAWLNQSEADKNQQVIHELVHLHLSLIADYSWEHFDILAPKDESPKFNKSIQTELRRRHESATQDLAYAIFDKFFEDRTGNSLDTPQHIA